MPRQRSRMKRSGFTWTDEEDALLLEMKGENYSDREIGRLLERSSKAVERRWVTLKPKEKEMAKIEEFDPFEHEVALISSTPKSRPRITLGALIWEEKPRSEDGQLYTDGTYPDSTWGNSQLEVFKSAVRMWIEGDAHSAIQYLFNSRMTALNSDSPLTDITEEFTYLAARVAIRNTHIHTLEQEMLREQYSFAERWRKHQRSESCITLECRGDLHIESVQVRTKPHSVLVSSTGVQLLPGQAGQSGRGSGVVMQYRCDVCGERFAVERCFDRGSVTTHTYPRAFPPAGEGELWRD